jgi:hypothetical protein
MQVLDKHTVVGHVNTAENRVKTSAAKYTVLCRWWRLIKQCSRIARINSNKVLTLSFFILFGIASSKIRKTKIRRCVLNKHVL